MNNKTRKAELSIKLSENEKNGKFKIIREGDFKDFSVMTNFLIENSDKMEVKSFIATMSTIVEAYKTSIGIKK